MATSAWDLIVAGRLEEAVEAADQEYREFSGHGRLGNKVLALLLLGRFDAAAAVCDEMIRLSRYVVDGHFVLRGVANWLAGREDEAIASWKAGSNAQYTDASGGVTIPALLTFASIRRSDEVLRQLSNAALKKLCRGRRVTLWPGPVARFLVGNLTEEELLSSAGQPAALAPRQWCQAEFYVGVRRFAEGDRNGYAQYLARSCSHGAASILEAESYLARRELERAEAQARA